jgi:hypothetical protein
MMKLNTCLVPIMALASMAASAAEPVNPGGDYQSVLADAARAASDAVNVAQGRPITADSVMDKHRSPSLAVDGDISGESRWVSAAKPGPHWLEVDLQASRTIKGAHLYSGWQGSAALRKFELQAWYGKGWSTIPGSRRTDNAECDLALAFDAPVTTTKVRLWIADDGAARVAELLIWDDAGHGVPALGAGIKPLYKNHPVLVNQIGYNLEWPKRFTAPLLEKGAFTISAVGSDDVLFTGEVLHGIGDFTAFRPAASGRDYIITVSGGDLHPGRSDPFAVAPFLLQNSCFAPALQFWNDDRAVTGTVPMAFGAAPWRDGPYYGFDVPSLVMLYLAAPDYFINLPPEMDWAKDRAKVTDPAFALKRPMSGKGIWDCDENSLEVTRRYYAELDAPRGERVPDLIQCIHWGVGWWLLKPVSDDYADDPAGRRIHPETIANFAYFLYAYPWMERYFSEKFYRSVLDFTLAQWKQAGLFEVNTAIGTFKGRNCPGYSILPNLMMHEVARRAKLANADDFFRAATAQATWVVQDLDFNDPRTTKGQRMSEHKLMMGLTTLLRDYPDRAPQGLQQKIEQWAQIMIARSQNMWDFRKYDADHWALPKQAPGNPSLAGSAGWNEPGNLAGFPALAFAVADLLPDPGQAQRLREIGVGQFDALFGRNPVGAASPAYPREFQGVERGWPRHFPAGYGAELEKVRGALNSSASNEHYPFNPRAAFRHPEGWTAFNSAFNVGLAVAARSSTSIEVTSVETGKAVTSLMPDRRYRIILRAPFGSTGRVVELSIRGKEQRISLGLPVVDAARCEAATEVVIAQDGYCGPGRLVFQPGEKVVLSYGYGFLRQSLAVTVEKQ